MPHGLKICPNKDCRKPIKGCRTLICPHCKEKVGKALEEKQKEARKILTLPDGYAVPEGKITIIHTPAGLPPTYVAPNEHGVVEDNDVFDWATELRQNMLRSNVYLTNDALAYWTQYSVPEQYRTNARSLIKSLPDYVVKTEGVAL